MTELRAAVEAAVDSLDEEPARARSGSHTGVRVHPTHDLPMVARPRPSSSSFSETIREQFGPGALVAWTALREAAVMLALFWVAAIGVSFVGDGSAVEIPGVGNATVISVALVAAVVLRAVVAALRRSEQSLTRR